MNDIDTTRIKEMFYNKLQEEKATRNKKMKRSAMLAMVAVLSLMSMTAIAANVGALDSLFSNFRDVMPYVQTANKQTSSNGITMELTSYLADNNGMVAELVFTKDDGSPFARDTMAVSSSRWFRPADITINNAKRSITQENIVSGDGLNYYCFPIIHYDIESVKNVPLKISVSKLVYNMNSQIEMVAFDLHDVFLESEVKSLDYVEDGDLGKLFDNTSDNPVRTESGIMIHAIVFAHVTVPPTEFDPNLPQGDGVDLGGFHEENNIVGIKYTHRLVENNREHNIFPIGLHDNDDYLGMGLGVDDEISYVFFRVADFSNLAYIRGIDFRIESNDYIEGSWIINTQFAANKEANTVAINKLIETENHDTTFVLTNADISFLSITLTYEIKDKHGNLLIDINPLDLNNYYLSALPQEVKLLFNDGNEIALHNSGYSNPGRDGIIHNSYEIDMNPAYYTLFNTSRLMAIIVDGEQFEVY